MTKPLSMLLLLGFSAIALGGLFTMGHHNGYGGCFAAATSGQTCPDKADPLVLLDFHIKPFKDFSASFAARALIGFLALIFLSFGAVFSAALKTQKKPTRSRGFSALLDTPPALYRLWLAAWLSLREKRDPASAL